MGSTDACDVATAPTTFHRIGEGLYNRTEDRGTLWAQYLCGGFMIIQVLRTAGV